MRKYMLMLAVAGLAAPAMVAAQDPVPTDPAAPPPATTAPAPGEAPIDQMSGTTDPQAREQAMSSWPADRKASYEQWPTETQDYYWTLTQPRQELFWRLRDEDKGRVLAMNEAQREQAWSMIERQASTPPATTGAPGQPMPGDTMQDDTMQGEPMPGQPQTGEPMTDSDTMTTPPQPR